MVGAWIEEEVGAVGVVRLGLGAECCLTGWTSCLGW